MNWLTKIHHLISELSSCAIIFVNVMVKYVFSKNNLVLSLQNWLSNSVKRLGSGSKLGQISGSWSKYNVTGPHLSYRPPIVAWSDPCCARRACRVDSWRCSAPPGPSWASLWPGRPHQTHRPAPPSAWPASPPPSWPRSKSKCEKPR